MTEKTTLILKQQTFREKLRRLLWLYVKITAGAVAAFLMFWLIAIILYGQGRQWQYGIELEKWQYYLGTIEWYTLMAYLVGAGWIFTKEDSSEIKDGKVISLRSRRFNRCLLIALPFVGLGGIIGKSSDAIDQLIGVISFITTVTIIGLFIIRDFSKWKRG